MSSSTSPAPAAFSLFPSPNASKPPPAGRNQTPLGRRSGSRERRASTSQNIRSQTPQQDHDPVHATSPPRHGRQTPQSFRAQTPQHHDTPQQWPLGGQQLPQDGMTGQEPPAPTVERPVSPVLPTQQPPVRNSIAKLPLDDEPGPAAQQPLRSIFPTYNPGLPLDRQEYAPTQKSPTRIPRAVISRQSYHQGESDNTPRVHSPTQSPLVVDDSGHRWARPRPQDAPVQPKVSTTEHLKSFWKVTNGWRASQSEGRVFFLKFAQEKDAPVYTLSSSTQPFYNIRLDPTSASARVRVMRHDPNKPYKEPKNEAGSSSSSLIGGSTSSDGAHVSNAKVTDTKHWHEALSTTMEEESRRHQPEDGLVALLMPIAAMRMALEKANDQVAVMTAEREGARLVWDDDSSNYFLVHPALATPFCVTVDRQPAWSRVEYTLEHHESPRHLAKLTRDSTGGGWLELDTGLASKIESFYIVDVAVSALTLVASLDEKNQPAATEAFEPPPLLPPPEALGGVGSHRKSASPIGKLVSSGKKQKKGRKASKMEQFDIDVESQDDSIGKEARVKVREGIDRLPFVLRVPAKIAKALFKCFIWILTAVFKCLRLVFGSCYRLVGSKY